MARFYAVDEVKTGKEIDGLPVLFLRYLTRAGVFEPVTVQDNDTLGMHSGKAILTLKTRSGMEKAAAKAARTSVGHVAIYEW